MKKMTMIAAALCAVAFSATPAFADDWLTSIKRTIASKQTYPRTAQMRGEEGTAKVKVYMSSAGKVEKTELVTSSGSSALDREAVALITRIGSLPTPPAGTSSVVVPLTWKLI